MKILKAPNKNTVDRTCSAGTVSFVNGIAVKFSPSQEEHFVTLMPGYSVEEIPDPIQPGKAAVKAASKAPETPKAPEAPKPPNPDEDTTKTAEGGSEGSESSEDGSGDEGNGEGSEDEKDLGEHFENAPAGSLKVELPVNKDGKDKVIVPFAEMYGIDTEGTKKDILLRIYADPRFEK